MTTTGRRRDVMWGYFANDIWRPGRRRLEAGANRKQVAMTHAADALYENNPGPIFKITEPRTQIRAGRGGKRGR